MSQYFAVLPVGRLYRYFNILSESSEKIHNAFDRKGRGVTSHER
jgi:hypothetical protein